MLLPPCIYGPVDKWSKSSPFHGGVPGSNPGRVTKEKQKFLCKTNVRSADLKANNIVCSLNRAPSFPYMLGLRKRRGAVLHGPVV